MKNIAMKFVSLLAAMSTSPLMAQMGNEVMSAANEADKAIGAVVAVSAGIAVAFMVIHWFFSQDKSKAKSLTWGFLVGVAIMGVISSDMVPFISDGVRKIGTLNNGVTGLLK